MARRPDLSNVLRRFRADVRGGTLATFAIALVGLSAATGAAVDYAQLQKSRHVLQAAADMAALGASREFRLGNAASTTIEAVARNLAVGALTGKIADATISPAVDRNAKSVTVAISATVPGYFTKLRGGTANVVTVSATAKISGGSPVCVIGLDQSANPTLFMQKSARLYAPGCAVYSDSKKNNGIQIQDSAKLEAAFVCSSGGVNKVAAGTVTPDPQKDCPVLPDPLGARPAPSVGSSCTYTNLEVRDTVAILNPGVYCGGLKILASHGKSATATLNPGIYVIKDGPLMVGGNVLIRDPKNLLVALDGDATLTGKDVGFYFVTSNPNAILDKVARLTFLQSGHVSLEAPKSGEMAGLLFFEDRNVSREYQHFITSDDTRMLLGTIYLPKGNLLVDSSKPVADKSPYTIVVVNRFFLNEGPTMVMNSNYSSTDVPVPEGVGPNAKVFLAK